MKLHALKDFSDYLFANLLTQRTHTTFDQEIGIQTT